MRVALDHALLEAHAAGDGDALAGLYARAGDLARAQGQIDAACFFWTQGFVFALVHDDPRAGQLHRKLAEYGREE